MRTLPTITNKGHGLFDFFIPIEEEALIKKLIAIANGQDHPAGWWLWNCEETWASIELQDGVCVSFNLCNPETGCGIWVEDFYRPEGDEIVDGTLEPTEPSLDNILHVAATTRELLELARRTA